MARDTRNGGVCRGQREDRSVTRGGKRGRSESVLRMARCAIIVVRRTELSIMLIGVAIRALVMCELERRRARALSLFFVTQVASYIRMFTEQPERGKIVIELRSSRLLPPLGRMTRRARFLRKFIGVRGRVTRRAVCVRFRGKIDRRVFCRCWKRRMALRTFDGEVSTGKQKLRLRVVEPGDARPRGGRMTRIAIRPHLALVAVFVTRVAGRTEPQIRRARRCGERIQDI